MPTPIGHSLLSTAIYSQVNRNKLELNWFDYLICLFIGIFPDLDFIPGLMLGTPSRFHHGITHSLLFGIIIGTMTGLPYYIFRKKDWANYSVTLIGIYWMHLLADFLAVDTTFPFGSPLFWPLWRGYLLSPVPIFLDVYRSSASSDFLASLFNCHNLKTVMMELLICGLILFLVYIKNFNRRKKAANQASINTN